MSKAPYKAGLFVAVSLVLLVFMVIQVGKGGFFSSGTYELVLEVPTAVGLDRNTPVQIAGVDVGLVRHISLTPQNHARLLVSVFSSVRLPQNSRAMIKQTGILGDAYIEIIPGNPALDALRPGDVINDVAAAGDFNSVTGQFSLIANDVQAVTSQMKKLMAGDDSSFSKSMNNIEQLTTMLMQITARNEKNINDIIGTMKVITENVNYLLSRNSANINSTLDNVNGITADIRAGKGTVGRLIKDEQTIDKIHQTLDNVNGLVGGVNRFQVQLGARSEYLAGTGSFKNYVEVAIKPRPDKAFLLEIVSDPDPSFNTTNEVSTITSGGATSTVDITRRTKNVDGFRFSAQLAKQFENFTLRGGMIESSGGIGVDYRYGPVGVNFSAFDFKTNFGQRPHLKAWSTAQVSRSFFLMGGLDDFINPNQDLDWFLGGGVRFTDDDIKSLLGLFAAGAR